jgi:hypothetical protein
VVTSRDQSNEKPEALQLGAEVGDPLVGDRRRVDAVALRGPLGRQPEAVEADRVEDAEALHPLVAGHQVDGGVALGVADVQPGARRVGEHHQRVELLAVGVLDGLEGPVLGPVGLPAGLDARRVVQGAVRLRLELDAAGRVVQSEILASSSPAFEQAMAELLEEIRFHPARDAGGRAVPSVIEYVHRFTLEQRPTVAIGGRVRLAGGETELAGARVEASSPDRPDEDAIVVQSAADGSFELFDLPPGRWVLIGTAPGLRSDELEVVVEPGERVEVRLFLAQARQELAEEAGETMIIFGDRLEPELTERRMDAAQVRFLPGTGGDVVRAVQTQPGVARTPFNSGTLLVRGTPADATAFQPRRHPHPPHLPLRGPLHRRQRRPARRAALPARQLRRRYGRRMGGLVELVPAPRPSRRAPATPPSTCSRPPCCTTRSWARAPPSASPFAAATSTCCSRPWSTSTPPGTCACRATPTPSSTCCTSPAPGERSAPCSWPARTTSPSRPSPRAARPRSAARPSLLRAWASWTRPLGEAWELELTGMLGPERTVATLEDEEQAREQATRGQARLELNRPVLAGGSFGWRLGLDLEFALDEAFAYNTSELGGFYLYAEDEAGEQDLLMPAVYLEQVQKAGDLTVIPGVRVDGLRSSEGYRASAIDPRVRLRWDLASSSVIHAGAGRYSQFPLSREFTDNGTGNPELGPEHATQLSLGAEHRFSPELSLEGVAYLSLLDRLIVGHDDRFTFELAPPPMAPFDLGEYANDGTGRVYGLELLTRYEDPVWFAFAALTLSRSTRLERPDGEPGLFEYDQPYMITVLGSRSLPRGWRLGARGRLNRRQPLHPHHQPRLRPGRAGLAARLRRRHHRPPAALGLAGRAGRQAVDLPRLGAHALRRRAEPHQPPERRAAHLLAGLLRGAARRRPPHPADLRAARRLVIPILLLACGSQSYEPSHIDSLKVVAVELDPPEVDEGDLVTLTVHVANPDELEVELLIWTCTEVGAQGCMEAGMLQPADWMSVVELEGATARLRREVPAELGELFDLAGESVEIPLFALACEVDRCSVVQRAREAVEQGSAAPRLQGDLAQPERWLQEVPADRSSLTVRSVRLSNASESSRNENPTYEARFAEADDPVFEAPPGSLSDLSFLTSDPNFETVYLYSFTTIGRFAERRVRAESQIVRTWLELPEVEAEGRLWVVFDDRDGGIAVYSQAVRAVR